MPVNLLSLFNQLKDTDKTFFAACVIIVILIVAVYYLIPLIKKSQYKEQRDNLLKREQALRESRASSSISDVENTQSEPASDIVEE